MKVCVTFLFLAVGNVCFVDAGSVVEHSRGGFEHRVFDRIISMAEKYLAYLTGSGRVLGQCLPGFVKNQDHCYKVFDIAMNWETAKQLCAALDTDLVTVENANTLQFLKGQVTKGSYKEKNFWTSATDVETDRTYLWTDRYNKKRPVTGYTAWHSGQPGGGTGENCLYLKYDQNFDWNDAKCSNEYGVICQGH